MDLDVSIEIEKAKEEKFEKDFAALDEAVKAALKQLLKSYVWPQIKFAGNDIKIITDDTPSYRRILTLKNVDAVPRDREGYFCENLTMVLKKEQNRFCFVGELEHPTEETAEIFALTFDGAEVEIEVYNSCNNMNFWNDPWDFLRKISFAIEMKAQLPGDYCNAKEKELLPLIREIVALEYWMELPEQETISFEKLKKLTHQYGYIKAETLLGELETVKPVDHKYYKNAKKLISVLCKKQYEPLWREIYNKIADSQADYPNKADSLCNKQLLSKVRNDIQALMEAKGYIGTYPDFVKDSALNGIHLAQSYNMTYFVGMEKRTEYHIHCYESFQENDVLIIQFVCGTAFLKKDEDDTDIFDCLFDAKGYRLFNTMHHYIPMQAEDDAFADDLETSVTIAVKKAECAKLTKHEQKQYYGESMPGFSLFFWTFLITGGMFGISMTLITMLICIIATAAFGLFASIPEMLTALPWWLFLAIGWIGFGGAMGIVEVLSRRK